MNILHGIDIIEISRIREAIEDNNLFKKRVFTEKEIEYCEGRKLKFQSFAARFAAKESFLKAIGTGLTENISLIDIEILNNSKGAPYILLHNHAKELFEKNKFANISISISHSDNYAIASVIIVT